jgi:hypothetical protein
MILTAPKVVDMCRHRMLASYSIGAATETMTQKCRVRMSPRLTAYMVVAVGCAQLVCQLEQKRCRDGAQPGNLSADACDA